MKKERIIVISAVLLLGMAGAWLFYGYVYKDARNIREEQPAFSISAERLLTEYSTNPKQSDSLFLNKTIEINGVVTQMSDSVATLDSQVFCGFDAKPGKIAMNKKITVKGRCIGYDELFNEVKLDQCTIKE